jgi:hypothetical protein
VLVARVVGHQVHEDPDAAPAGFGHEAIDVVEGAQVGLDGAEVGDVVAPVGIG